MPTPHAGPLAVAALFLTLLAAGPSGGGGATPAPRPGSAPVEVQAPDVQAAGAGHVAVAGRDPQAADAEPVQGPGPDQPGPSRAQRPAGESTPYALPLRRAILAALFEAPAHRWAAGHRGVDLRAEPRTEVLAPAGGWVTFSGMVVDRPVVTVLHGDGRRSSLEPVVDAPAAGTYVEPGAVLGTVGSGASHCAPRQCVHWGVRSGEVYLDPLTLLPASGPTVLLPLP